MAYGAPCIQLTRESTAQNSPFHMKIVIAEVESGTVINPQTVGPTDSEEYSGTTFKSPLLHVYDEN